VSATYKTVSTISLSSITPYAEEIIGDHQCVHRRNNSTSHHIFCIPQILEKKWEFKEVVHQLFINFKKAYDSIRREVFYNISIEIGSPIIMNEIVFHCTYGRFRVVKN